jgi:hypothetical protein
MKPHEIIPGEETEKRRRNYMVKFSEETLARGCCYL